MYPELERFIEEREYLRSEPPERILAFRLPDMKFFAPIIRPEIKPFKVSIVDLWGDIREMTDERRADFVLAWVKYGMASTEWLRNGMLVELMCMRTSKALTRANFNLERVDSALFA